MSIKLLGVSLMSLMLTCSSAYAQDLPYKTEREGLLSENLTEIVVTALVLGFSYSVLNSFKK